MSIGVCPLAVCRLDGLKKKRKPLRMGDFRMGGWGEMVGGLTLRMRWV